MTLSDASRDRVFGRLTVLARPHVHHLAVSLVLLAVTTVIETLVVPVLLTTMLVVVVGPSVLGGRYTIPVLGIDMARLSAAAPGSASRSSLLVAVALAGVAAMALRALCHVGRLLLAYRFSFAVARDLRARVFAHLLGQSASFFEREPTGALLSRLTSDVPCPRTGLGHRCPRSRRCP